MARGKRVEVSAAQRAEDLAALEGGRAVAWDRASIRPQTYLHSNGERPIDIIDFRAYPASIFAITGTPGRRLWLVQPTSDRNGRLLEMSQNRAPPG